MQFSPNLIFEENQVTFAKQFNIKRISQLTIPLLFVSNHFRYSNLKYHKIPSRRKKIAPDIFPGLIIIFVKEDPSFGMGSWKYSVVVIDCVCRFTKNSFLYDYCELISF